MSYLVAAIEHHARKLTQAVTRAVAEKCSGYSDYEAGDFLTDEQAMSIAVEETRAMRAERAERWRQVLVDADAPQEVAEPAEYGINKGLPLLDLCGGFGAPNSYYLAVQMPDGTLRTERRDATPKDFERHKRIVDGMRAAYDALTQTPTAGQRGESPAGDDSPTSPAGSPEHHCDCGLSDDMEDLDTHSATCAIWDDPTCYFCGNLTANVVNTDCDGDTELVCKKCAADELGALPMPTDPSPTIASRQHQPSVRGEGSPADSDIPPSPAGERPNWRTWAAPAICDVLANHTPDGSDIGIWCTPEWADFRDPDSADHARHFTDWQDWRDHVSDLIAERLDTAWRARQSQKPQK